MIKVLYGTICNENNNLFLNSFDTVQMYKSNIKITVRLNVTTALTVRISVCLKLSILKTLLLKHSVLIYDIWLLLSLNLEKGALTWGNIGYNRWNNTQICIRNIPSSHLKQWDQGTFLHEALELEHHTSSMVLPPSLLTAPPLPLYILTTSIKCLEKIITPHHPPLKKCLINKGLITVFLFLYSTWPADM